MPAPRTAVIGAGPAGCAAAHRLARTGRSVLLFESAAAPGGRTTAWRRHGLAIDSGAGFFTDFYPTLRQLLAEVDLDDSVIPLARATSLSHAGSIASLTIGSVRSFAAYPFLDLTTKARLALAAGVVMHRHRHLDLSRPDTLAHFDDMSVEADALRRVGERAYQFVVRPGIEPFWYFSCSEVSRALFLALFARAATARFFTLRGGMDLLCQRLADRIELAAATEVTQIAAAGEPRHGRLAVRFRGGEEHVDEVVVATTATVAARLTAGLGPLVAAPMRDFLGTQRYACNVHAAFLVERRRCPARMSALFPCGPGVQPVAALSFHGPKGQRAGDREVMSVFLGEAESRRCRLLDDTALYAHARALADQLLPGVAAGAEPFALVRRDEAIPVHAVGRYRMAAALERQQSGPVVFAGDYLATATVDGALRTGLAAAAALERAGRTRASA